MDFSHHAVTTENDENNPMEAPYRHQLTEALTQGQNPKESKILSFKQMQPPQTREGMDELWLTVDVPINCLAGHYGIPQYLLGDTII